MNFKRVLRRIALAIVFIPAVIYLADWGIWRVKFARGGGMSTATVSRIVVAPLKGGKEEYYADGTSDLDCSQSLFRQAGSGACWWLQRHRIVFDR